MKSYTDREITANVSKINTMFFLSHASLEGMLSRVTRQDRPWRLGKIEEGWEWFAFTFRDQAPIALTDGEVNQMIVASDQVTRLAYSRMSIDASHKWARHADREVAHIMDYCGLVRGQLVLDLGCGSGRHAIRLAQAGLNVAGVDYVESFIRQATMEAESAGVQSARFIVDDCRTYSLPEKVDAVVCLYDVIGSYADNEKNADILSNIARNLKPGGHALLSVMNMELTRRKATQFFSLRAEAGKLLDLSPSRTMEKTGDVFDPQFYMIDAESGVVYRKEQFAYGSALPEEWIVRDRRFTKHEIEAMCRAAGLTVMWSRVVRAGDWETALDANDDRAKEILVLCTN